MRTPLALLGVLLAAIVVVTSAGASSMVSTSSVTKVTLGVNKKGEAMVTYKVRGKTVHVLAWGAINARPPVHGQRQVALKFQYDGGYKKYYTRNPQVKAQTKLLRQLQAQSRQATSNQVRWSLAPRIKGAFHKLHAYRRSATNYWKTFRCGKYDGPKLAFAVAACKAPDGTYWAVQSWQRALPDYGVTPTTAQKAMEAHLAHWRGPLPVLTVHSDWAYHGKWQHLYGTYTYKNRPVFGFASTHKGEPLDSWGRNVYLDALNSKHGSGWQRDNSFLTHNPTGAFCYSINPHGPHPAATGEAYRLTIEGPGVTPDVSVVVAPPAPYSKTTQQLADAEIEALNDRLCFVH